MLLPNRHGSIDTYRYGFQGQEKDDEVKGEGNSINYKYRMHDPRVGRFFAVDPLIISYPFYTPYSFSGNKVVAFGEIEGLEEGWVIHGEKVVKVQGPTEEVANSFQTFELAQIGLSLGQRTPSMLDSYMGMLEKTENFTAYTKPSYIWDNGLEAYANKTRHSNPGLTISRGLFHGVEAAPGVIVPEIAFARLGQAYNTWKTSKLARQTVTKINKVDDFAGLEFVDDFARQIEAPLAPLNITSIDDIIGDSSVIWGKSADDIAKAFNDAGYKATVHQSTKGSKLSSQVKIEGHSEITNIQVHPGGGRHLGEYYKISTSTQGKIKIVNPKTYKVDPSEKATIINHVSNGG
jgi:RHS repeat-associated protein